MRKKKTIKKKALTRLPKKIKLDSAYYHEACDRTFCIQMMIEEMLSSHPAIMQNRALQGLVAKAQSALGDVYQRTGAKM